MSTARLVLTGIGVAAGLYLLSTLSGAQMLAFITILACHQLFLLHHSSS